MNECPRGVWALRLGRGALRCQQQPQQPGLCASVAFKLGYTHLAAAGRRVARSSSLRRTMVGDRWLDTGTGRAPLTTAKNTPRRLYRHPFSLYKPSVASLWAEDPSFWIKAHRESASYTLCPPFAHLDFLTVNRRSQSSYYTLATVFVAYHPTPPSNPLQDSWGQIPCPSQAPQPPPQPFECRLLCFKPLLLSHTSGNPEQVWENGQVFRVPAGPCSLRCARLCRLAERVSVLG